MANISNSINEARLLTHYNKIKNRLSPAALNTGRQIALSLSPQIENLLSRPNGERQLIREIFSQIQYKNLTDMASGDIEALVFIVLMEAAKSAREDLKAIMDGVKNTNQQKKSYREKLNELMEEAVDESEGKFRRFPPLIRK